MLASKHFYSRMICHHAHISFSVITPVRAGISFGKEHQDRNAHSVFILHTERKVKGNSAFSFLHFLFPVALYVVAVLINLFNVFR